VAKKIMLISRHPPYGSAIAREAIDALLAASVYDQDLGLLFMDDGVFQLLGSQDSTDISQKNIASVLPVLPLYDVENIYVHWESLGERGITPSELVLANVQIIDSNAVGHLLAQQDQLLSF
jgi:tRNA 2-thiouridine synthesizing protein C